LLGQPVHVSQFSTVAGQAGGNVSRTPLVRKTEDVCWMLRICLVNDLLPLAIVRGQIAPGMHRAVHLVLLKEGECLHANLVKLLAVGIGPMEKDNGFVAAGVQGADQLVEPGD